jgi:L-iditol 2-dehydrogenase
MKYLICETQDRAALRDGEIPEPGAGEMLVHMTACGICGTDALKIYGAYPKPQKLGHEVVGVVHALGAGVTRFHVGQRVGFAHHAPDYSSHFSQRGSETMDARFKRSNIEPGGFSDFVLLHPEHVENTVVPVPDHVSDLRAVFMEPLACCLRGLDRVPLREGDSALVVGVGAIGMLFVPLLRDRSVSTVAADVRPERLALAQQWGAAAGAVSGQDDLPAVCRRVSDGRGVDVVILTVVNDAVLKTALECVRDGGTILLFGGKPGSSLSFAYWAAFLREINFVTSYSATPDGLRRAMAILAGPGYASLESLVSHTFGLETAAQGFELVHQGKASKVVITPSPL